MALILCEECGKEISDKACSCPHCGCPVIGEIEKGFFHIHWVDFQRSSIRKTKVILDGKEVAVLKSDGSADIEVYPGQHTVELWQGKHLLLEEMFDISRTNPEEYFAFKEVMGWTHAALMRVDAEESKKWDFLSKNTPKCPTCGSKKIKKISLSKKIFAVEMVGLASNSIGKTFECKKCGYKW